MDSIVVWVASVVGWVFLIASWSLDGKAGEVCNFASGSAFMFGIAWYLSGMAHRWGDKDT